MARPSDAQFIAKWLEPAPLRDAVLMARETGRNKPHYIPMESNFPLWCFLHSVKVEATPPRVTIDFKELRKRAGAGLPMGFADEQDEQDENLPEEARYLSAQAQPIYRAWGVRESELDIRRCRPLASSARSSEKMSGRLR